MMDTRTTLLCTASTTAAAAGPAFSLAFAEQWLRVVSLAIGIVVSLMLAYFAARRERRHTRNARLQDEQNQIFLSQQRRLWAAIPPDRVGSSPDSPIAAATGPVLMGLLPDPLATAIASKDS